VIALSGSESAGANVNTRAACDELVCLNVSSLLGFEKLDRIENHEAFRAGVTDYDFGFRIGLELDESCAAERFASRKRLGFCKEFAFASAAPETSVCLSARNSLSRPPHRKRSEWGRASGSEGVWFDLLGPRIGVLSGCGFDRTFWQGLLPGQRFFREAGYDVGVFV
jgi:hypothetical protein